MTDLPQAALIDLDDTILDDSGRAEECWRDACAGAAGIAGIETQGLYEAITRQRDWYWSDPERHREGRLDLRAATRRIVLAAFADFGLDLPDLARETAETYRDLREERISLFPDAVETLERLRSRGVRLGMITNGAAAAQRAKIERFGLAAHFDCIVIEGEFGVGKPHPRAYEAALRALDSDPAQTWSAGDNLDWDVDAPQRLGLYGIWVDHRRAGLPDGTPVRPDRIIHSLSELL